MKMTSWVLLGACTLCLPQYAVSANGWAVQQSYADTMAYQPPRTFSSSPDYGRPAYRPMRQWQREIPSRSQYRFRPLEGDNRQGRVSVNRVDAPVAPAARSVSYWGGAPAARGRFANRPASGNGRIADRMSHAYRPWARPLPVRAGNPYQSSQYRFRPMEKAQFARDYRQPQYRSLQVQIPAHYVFRPLNPIRRSAAPAVSQRAYRAPYPYMPYPNAGYRPVYPYPVQPLPMSRYAYGGGYPTEAGWYGAAPAISAPGWRTPYRPAMPPYYAQGMGSPARFRALPEPLPGTSARRNGYPGPAHRQMVPPPRYTYESPYWRWHYRPLPQTSGYPAAGQTAFRPVRSPERLNRFGTDWYDGRGDDEGAWYKLTSESLPAVTQQWADDGSILPEGETY